jgi:hypothetical protein
MVFQSIGGSVATITAAITWSDVAGVGFFIAGAFVGALAAIRIMRMTMEYLRHDAKRTGLAARRPFAPRNRDDGTDTADGPEIDT